MTDLIGKEGELTVPGFQGELRVRVRVTETKTVYGQSRVKIQPIVGSGEIWVAASRVEITEETNGSR